MIFQSEEIILRSDEKAKLRWKLVLRSCHTVSEREGANERPTQTERLLEVHFCLTVARQRLESTRLNSNMEFRP